MFLFHFWFGCNGCVCDKNFHTCVAAAFTKYSIRWYDFMRKYIALWNNERELRSQTRLFAIAVIDYSMKLIWFFFVAPNLGKIAFIGKKKQKTKNSNKEFKFKADGDISRTENYNKFSVTGHSLPALFTVQILRKRRKID